MAVLRARPGAFLSRPVNSGYQPGSLSIDAAPSATLAYVRTHVILRQLRGDPLHFVRRLRPRPPHGIGLADERFHICLLGPNRVSFGSSIELNWMSAAMLAEKSELPLQIWVGLDVRALQV